MAWSDLFQSNKSDDNKKEKNTSKLSIILTENEYITLTPTGKRQIQQWIDPFMNSSSLMALGMGCSVSFLAGIYVGRRMTSTSILWTRITNAQDLPSSFFSESGPLLRGRVVSVSDGDTIRFLHAPTIFHASHLQPDEKLSDATLPLRLCTIDTPEVAKFGKPAQPFGDEAKEYLESLIGGRMVRARLLMRDQYGRSVASVQYRNPWWWPFSYSRHVDELMIRAGLAEVYQGSGAVYGPRGKAAYLQLEQEARKRNKGIWSQGDKRESAAEFKARTK